jgi:D-sedoheptulose 7-phosphate isomerase
MQEKIRRQLEEGSQTIRKLRAAEIEAAARLTADALKSGKKVLLCGNGGSAADSQHIAAELVGRFRKERAPLPAIALTTDTSILTALTNDLGGDIIFSRQVEALGGVGDVLIALSTSGTSPNILKAAGAARKKRMKVVGFTGSNGAKLKGLCDACVMVDSSDTPRIQEAHITAAHIMCGLIEDEVFS